MRLRWIIITDTDLTALGAATSIAIALGAACLPEPLGHCGCAEPHMSWEAIQTRLAYALQDRTVADSIEDEIERTASAWRFGWPMRCLGCTTGRSWDFRTQVASEISEGTFIFPFNSAHLMLWMDYEQLTLPRRVIPVGLLVNTLFFAGL